MSEKFIACCKNCSAPKKDCVLQDKVKQANPLMICSNYENIHFPKVEIKEPIKSWWSGDKRVEPYMYKVSETIKKYFHNKQLSKADETDIYNCCYEAVYQAIKDFTFKEKTNE